MATFNILLNRSKLFSNQLNDFISKKYMIYKKLSSVQIGAKAELWRVFTQEDVNSFAKLSGDTNPLHLSENLSANTKFGKCIVHGALINGLVSAVLGTILPGPGTVLVSQVLNFTKPLYIGENVCAKIVVNDIKKRFIDCQYICETADGKKVLNGTAKLLLME